MTLPILEGTFTALVTPFRDDKVDYDALRSLVERQIAAGIDGLVPAGTTGESPTLTTQEHLELISAVVKFADGRVPVIAGTGSNSTAEAMHLTREADRLGASGFLQVAPYYNKPSQEGLYRHFAALAEVSEKPQVLYSIPGRCVVEIGIETVARLAEAYPQARTIKEAGGRVERVQQLRAATGDQLTILCGDDALTVPFISAGARGVISVASNLAPRIIGRITRLALENDFRAARQEVEKHYSLLTELVFLEGNPVTIKTAMALSGQLAPFSVRLPLCEMTPDNEARLRDCLGTLDLSEDVPA